MSETTTIGKSKVSRRVYRQANRDNTKRKPGFPLFHCWGATSECVPIVPPGAPISPDSEQLRPEILGKVPGKLTKNGWIGFTKWTELNATLDDLKRWHKWGASVGLQTRKFPACDIDVDDRKLAGEIEKLAYEHLGPAPCRTRTGSPRCLLLYRAKDGDLLRKRATVFMVGAVKSRVELLGVGQQFVAEGPHPKGGEYGWPTRHPCDGKPEDLTELELGKVDGFFAALGDLLNMLGYQVVSDNGSSAAAGKHRPIGSPELWRPIPPTCSRCSRRAQMPTMTMTSSLGCLRQSNRRWAKRLKIFTRKLKHGR